MSKKREKQKKNKEESMEKIKVETMGKEIIIKPSSKTPVGLRSLPLSIYDSIIPSLYTVAFLFYTQNDSISREQTSEKLKTCLSKTLTKFYPFAGRINGVTIDCNDEGAIFVDARVDNSPLSGFLRCPDFEALQQLLPLKVNEVAATEPLLLVQATYFQCGGMAIAICISHKIADAASISTFIRTWAAITRGEADDAVMGPEFVAAKFYPPANEAFKLKLESEGSKRRSVTKRFVFPASKIEQLRTQASSPEAVPRPTRVESITALLWRCIVAASPNITREKVLLQPADLRRKLPSLLSENMIGNLMFSTVISNEDGQVNITETVRELRKRAEELAEILEDVGESSSTTGSRLVGLMMDKYSKIVRYQTLEPYCVSSWCKFPLYEACYGWGSPVWVAGNVVPISDNVTVLIDSSDGQGIEAWVTLFEEEMSLFGKNIELLAFASPNPSVLI